jgi:AcrR family transcriptional regulator
VASRKRSTSVAPGGARRTRDPGSTREAILKAARAVLARDGKEGLSVAQVARRAGINRGTAYQHFQTREQLIEATAEWVSDRLYQAVYGGLAPAAIRSLDSDSVSQITRHLAEFAMENPELGCIWLFELLSSQRPAKDRFWQEYLSHFARVAATDAAQPGVDIEVVSVLTLAGMFLWPVWARSHARNSRQRQEMATRIWRELMRLCLHGSMRPEKYPELVAQVGAGK